MRTRVLVSSHGDARCRETRACLVTEKDARVPVSSPTAASADSLLSASQCRRQPRALTTSEVGCKPRGLHSSPLRKIQPPPPLRLLKLSKHLGSKLSQLPPGTPLFVLPSPTLELDPILPTAATAAAVNNGL